MHYLTAVATYRLDFSPHMVSHSFENGMHKSMVTEPSIQSKRVIPWRISLKMTWIQEYLEPDWKSMKLDLVRVSIWKNIKTMSAINLLDILYR